MTKLLVAQEENSGFFISKWMMLLWSLALVFMNFNVLTIGSFGLTIAVLSYPILVLWMLNKFQIRVYYYTLFSILMIYTLIIGLFAEYPVEFIKSFLLFLSLLIMLLVAVGLRLPAVNHMILSLKVFYVCSSLAAVFVILQFVDMNVFHGKHFNNPFGSFSTLGPGGVAYVPNELAKIKRPNSFFSEPSIAGWFMAFAMSVSLTFPVFGWKNKLLSILFAMAAILTFSLSGVLNVLVLLFLYIFFADWKTYRYVKYVVIVFLSLCIPFIVNIDLIDDRLLSMYEPGSSVYFRTVAPLMLLSDSLLSFPFGHALGQVGFIESKSYMQNWAQGSQTNIDNSFFFVIYYFGVVGIATVCFVLALLFKCIAEKRTIALVFLALFLALSETGALWSHGVILLIGYCVVLSRYSETELFDVNRKREIGSGH